MALETLDLLCLCSRDCHHRGCHAHSAGHYQGRFCHEVDGDHSLFIFAHGALPDVSLLSLASLVRLSVTRSTFYFESNCRLSNHLLHPLAPLKGTLDSSSVCILTLMYGGVELSWRGVGVATSMVSLCTVAIRC